MGIANPRPAMRAKEDRVIRARLARHAVLLKEFIAQGMDAATADRAAATQARQEIPNRKPR